MIGVGKQITEYFLQLLGKNTITQLDDILKAIQVPHQLARLSRPFSERSIWKAREWENFILFYNIPLFEKVISKRYLRYWSILVQSLYTLLKCNITLDQLNHVDDMLHEFVFDTEVLFTKTAMTSNIHLLLHISESVMNWGPLWAHSTYCFESANHHTLQAIHCSIDVNLQIVRYINMQKTVRTLQHSLYPHASSVVIDYCETLSKKRIKRSRKLIRISYLGTEFYFPNELLLRLQMTPNSTVGYTRIIKDGCLYMSFKIENKRSNNSFAKLNNGTFIRIVYFLVDTENNAEITVYNLIKTSVSKFSKHIHLINKITDEMQSIDSNEINIICAIINVEDKMYLCELPNLYNY